MTMTEQTKRRVYFIGDGSSPGHWKFIGGLHLMCEGSFELEPGEEFRAVVEDLLETTGFQAGFALVEETLGEEDELIEEDLLETLNADASIEDRES